MSRRLGLMFFLTLSLLGSALCYGHGHFGFGGSAIYINTIPYGGYYDNYYPYYSPYYPPYYPQYRCVPAPTCYPSGDCNYQIQQCGYY